MCQHLAPAALIVAADYPCVGHSSAIHALRAALPNTVIIALGSTANYKSPGALLNLGADAVVDNDRLQRPTLYDLLVRLRHARQPSSKPKAATVPEMAQPWRRSQLMGSLICDIDGRIVTANDCLGRWLGYEAAESLLGKYVQYDLLDSHDEWGKWKLIAGDMTTDAHLSITVRTRHGQLRWMKVQIFAMPDAPTNLQAVFVDQTEIAYLASL